MICLQIVQCARRSMAVGTATCSAPRRPHATLCCTRRAWRPSGRVQRRPRVSSARSPPAALRDRLSDSARHRQFEYHRVCPLSRKAGGHYRGAAGASGHHRSRSRRPGLSNSHSKQCERSNYETAALLRDSLRVLQRVAFRQCEQLFRPATRPQLRRPPHRSR